jgi:GNAT superfamily N-acetyltransferase
MADLDLTIVDVEGAAQLETVRTLFMEYATSLGFSLCFQNFEKELEGLPGQYARPEGRLLMARSGDVAAGCVGLRRLGAGICEMKRLYVRPSIRARGVGRGLAEAVIAQAREIGYDRMRLDTVEPLMPEAMALYRTLGFYDIASYTPNPLAGALCMELQL